ncbi:hypothetical protein ACFV5G_08255 [Streptomyces sp. NPDC059766]|uniref:hypothetical protein n=1 Tax=Streptomyces sp. NPDC059766 TaxID=3346940 RepID=UPI0036527385
MGSTCTVVVAQDVMDVIDHEVPRRRGQGPGPDAPVGRDEFVRSGRRRLRGQ